MAFKCKICGATDIVPGFPEFNNLLASHPFELAEHEGMCFSCEIDRSTVILGIDYIKHCWTPKDDEEFEKL